MRATLLFLAALFFVPYSDAAPAPPSGQEAKKKLEALKMRLTDVLTDWIKEKTNVTWLSDPLLRDMTMTCKPEVRILRRVSPNRAKAVIFFAAYSDQDRRFDCDVVLSVYLVFQDDCWTTETFEVLPRDDWIKEKIHRGSFAFLMMAIDEAAEKP